MVRGTQHGDASADEDVVSRVDRALAAMDAGLDELVAALDEGELAAFEDLRLVGFLQSVERFRNRLPVVDHAVLAEAGGRGLAERLAQPTLARVLVSAVRVSATEAHRRVKAAEAVGPRMAVTGAPLEPVRPVLAAAQRAGTVTPEQVQVIVRALSQVDRPGYDPADIDAGEALLTRFADTFAPTELTRLADRVVDGINPDGSRPDEHLQHDRRHVSLRPLRDGGWVGELRLTGVAGAKLAAVLRPLAKPRLDRLPDPDDATTDTDTDTDTDTQATLVTGQDERTYGQRMHDALEDVCDRMLRSGTLPDSGGIPATVIVTLTDDQLRRRVGVGHTSDGAPLTIPQILDLASQADIIPTVLTGTGAVEAHGRNRRIASPAQTWALIARDHGCSFPTCDRPPELSERHHITPWVDGGTTDLHNLTLLCRWHHHHFEQHGWTVTINPDGLPEWTPPRWIDPHQRPLLNHRIRQQLLDPDSQDRQPALVPPSPADGDESSSPP